MRINNKGYIERKMTKHLYRDWYLGKERIFMKSCIYIPEEYHGQHIRFKIEVVPQKEKTQDMHKEKLREWCCPKCFNKLDSAGYVNIYQEVKYCKTCKWRGTL